MHGEMKLRAEGYRTRDAHLLEWLARSRQITVVSRPEPFPRIRVSLRRARGASPERLTFVSPEVLAPSALWAGKRWWLTSNRYLPPVDGPGVILAWNPMAAAHYAKHAPQRRLVFDFLDDWLRHHSLESIHREVREAYALICDVADTVICNSEDTLARAHSMGRDDAILLPNGCDPERFTTESFATGDMPVIGYAGKLGRRLDFDLIDHVVASLPGCRFVFAGPVMDRRTHRWFSARPNLEWLGDVHYLDYPLTLARFDVGWVPHDPGDGAVGGDAIKIYEYRATALPVVSTPIVGADRLDGVRVATGGGFVEALERIVAAARAGRVPREPLDEFPVEHTWQHKAEVVERSIARALQ